MLYYLSHYSNSSCRSSFCQVPHCAVNCELSSVNRFESNQIESRDTSDCHFQLSIFKSIFKHAL